MKALEQFAMQRRVIRQTFCGGELAPSYISRAMTKIGRAVNQAVIQGYVDAAVRKTILDYGIPWSRLPDLPLDAGLRAAVATRYRAMGGP